MHWVTLFLRYAHTAGLMGPDAETKLSRTTPVAIFEGFFAWMHDIRKSSDLHRVKDSEKHNHKMHECNKQLKGINEHKWNIVWQLVDDTIGELAARNIEEVSRSRALDVDAIRHNHIRGYKRVNDRDSGALESWKRRARLGHEN